jgi:6-phosphogluconolactonase
MMALGVEVSVFEHDQAVGCAVAAAVAQAAQASIASRGRFCVAFSGGSLVNLLAPAFVGLVNRREIHCAAWRIFWVDERWVPHASPDSNYGRFCSAVLDRVPSCAPQVYPMPTTGSLEAAARSYAATLRQVVGANPGAAPSLDMVLLGLGRDGHTASLFPGHPALEETRRWVVPVRHAPKPPAVRLTLTLPMINAARRVLFVVAGAGKADAVERVLHSPGDARFPASLVAPAGGMVQWFLDHEAARRVSPRLRAAGAVHCGE